MRKIRVRSSTSQCTLWFYLDVDFAREVLAAKIRASDLAPTTSVRCPGVESLEKLTPIGRAITERVLGIGQSIEYILGRPMYFDLTIQDPQAWQRIFPEVVKIIREETYDLQAEVVPMPDGETWHVPLLGLVR
jgi:hypothetical protein